MLNPQGAEEFRRRKARLIRTRTMDGLDGLGMNVSNYSPRVLQQLITTGLVQATEIRVSDLRHQRRDLIDLTKAITFAMVYSSVSSRAFRCVSDSQLLDAWHRAQPRFPISDDHLLLPAAAELLEKRFHQELQSMRRGVMESISAEIRSESGMDDSDRMKREAAAARMIRMVRSEVWILLAVFEQHPERAECFANIQAIIREAEARSDLADILASLLVELVASIHGLLPPDRPPEPTAVTWYFGNQRGTGTRPRLKIAVTNPSLPFARIKTDIEQKGQSMAAAHSIEDFYRATGGESQMGLFYLSAARKAFRKAGASFDAFANYLPSSERAPLNLAIAL